MFEQYQHADEYCSQCQCTNAVTTPPGPVTAFSRMNTAPNVNTALSGHNLLQAFYLYVNYIPMAGYIIPRARIGQNTDRLFVVESKRI